MNLASPIDKYTAEIVLRTVTNSATETLTITAGSIAIGSPVILETNTASLPSTASNTGAVFYPQTGGGAANFVTRPATSTALVNNLLVGILKSGPRTDYLDRAATGLAQCYGPYVGAIVQRAPASVTINPGNVLLPESLQFLILGTGPVTAGATYTLSHVEEPAIGGLIIAMASVASSSATETTTSTVWIRCM